MANRYETYDREQRQDDSNGGGFVLGLLAGAVIGTGLGMLFAPKAGAELRDQLSEQANEFASTASRQYRRAASSASDLAERGREMYGSVREAASRGANEAERYVRETADSVADDLSSAVSQSGLNQQGPRS